MKDGDSLFGKCKGESSEQIYLETLSEIEIDYYRNPFAMNLKVMYYMRV